jgi:acyl carrier protein
MQIKLEGLRPHLATIFEVDPATLQANTVFRELELWDSFSMLSIVALITEHTGKQITIRDLDKTVSIDDLGIFFE